MRTSQKVSRNLPVGRSLRSCHKNLLLRTLAVCSGVLSQDLQGLLRGFEGTKVACHDEKLHKCILIKSRVFHVNFHFLFPAQFG